MEHKSCSIYVHPQIHLHYIDTYTQPLQETRKYWCATPKDYDGSTTQVQLSTAKCSAPKLFLSCEQNRILRKSMVHHQNIVSSSTKYYFPCYQNQSAYCVFKKSADFLQKHSCDTFLHSIFLQTHNSSSFQILFNKKKYRKAE